jgi:hypothetical protein
MSCINVRLLSAVCVFSVAAIVSFSTQNTVEAAPVTTGLNTWLDASDPTTLLDDEGDNASSGFFNGFVRTWVDKSGNGRNAVQATAVNQPSFVPNAIGGQSAILTDGLNDPNRDFIRVSSVGGLVKPEYIVVTRLISQTSNDILLSDPANGYHTGTYSTPPGNIGTLASSGAILAQRPLNVGQVGIVRQFFDRGSGSSTSQFSVNGNVINFTLGAGDYATGSLNTLDIGAFSPDTSHSQNAQVAEVLIYNAGLNTAERNIVENYLSAKYSGSSAIHEAPILNDLYIGDEQAQGHYDRDVIGIGRASDGALLASPTNAGAGLILSELASAPLAVGDYVLAGDKVVTNSLTANDAGGALRWDRVWYVDPSAEGLSARLTFDFTEGGITLNPAADYALLYSSTDPYSFTSQMMQSGISGNQVFFDVANLTNGYFTIAEVIPAPEPNCLMLVGAGAAMLMVRRRRAAKQ